MDAATLAQWQLMQQQMQAMHVTNQQQQAINAQQQQQIHDLSVAAMASAAAAANVQQRPFVPVVKIAHPPTYDGAPASFDDWIASLDQHISYYRIGTDAEQISLAAAHLKGPARDWFTHLGAAPTTWALFVAGLRAQFQPVTTEETARAHLHELVQGRSSINEYVASFRRLIIAIPSMDASTQMFQFLHGLKPSLQTIHRQAQPASLELAISLAVRMGSTMHGASSAFSSGSAPLGAAMDLSAMRAELDQAERDHAAASSSSAPPGFVMLSNVEHAEMVAAMYAGRNNGGGSNGRGAQGASGGFRGPKGLPRIKGFSEEKVKAYMAADKCFGCDAIGHGSRTCPKRRVDKDGNVSWGK